MTQNNNISIDFAHESAAFPVWHRRYILTVEREFQRIMNNSMFGFPYWQWEENDMSPFDANYYGIPPHAYGANNIVNVTGRIVNPDSWHTVCDLTYINPHLTCSDYWKVCNPAEDLAEKRTLQRGGVKHAYLPNVNEIKIAIAANSYSGVSPYILNTSRSSFHSRLEGWNMICSAEPYCVSSYRDPIYSHMHNLVHVWVGGHMDDVPAAVNDPMFNLHHCNVDRIFESWIAKYESINLPAYAPVTTGHPGHNRDDFMVPFFPLIKPGQQYQLSKRWGYRYDELIPATISDNDIRDCDVNAVCAICDANTTCINCTGGQTCPLPAVSPPQTGGVSLSLGLGAGLGVGIGLPIILLAIVGVVVLAVFAYIKSTVDITLPQAGDIPLETYETKT
jgi:tyrosinase